MGGEDMKDEVKLLLEEAWQEHRGKLVGATAGLLLGILVLIFGFWSMFFVLLCGGIGLFLGTRLDKGGSWLQNIKDSLPDDFHRWK